MAVPKVQIADETVTGENVTTLMVVGGPGVPLREVCLGRNPPDPTKIKAVPPFEAYLKDVVPPPDNKTWVNDAAKASLKQMYGNDQYGDCVIASIGHGVGVSSANESGTAIVGTTSEIVSEYARICGPGDNGCVITDTKDAMMASGVSVGGKKRLIDGYAAIPPANKLAVQTAILIAGGGVNIGFNVPSEWMGSATYDGAVWDTPRRYSFVGGHDIRAVGYNAVGVQFSTWGIVITMTWAALANPRIVDEMYVELERDWNADGTAPSGLDTVGLKAALDAYKAGKIPDWKPPVSPPPVPPIPPVPPTPSGAFSGTETTVYVNGAIQSRTFAPGRMPVVTGDTHEIDLSRVGPLRRILVRRKILALLEDNDVADVAVHGDKIVVSRADGIDWNAFLAFLTKLLPIILQIISIFGGL